METASIRNLPQQLNQWICLLARLWVRSLGTVIFRSRKNTRLLVARVGSPEPKGALPLRATITRIRGLLMGSVARSPGPLLLRAQRIEKTQSARGGAMAGKGSAPFPLNAQ